MEDIMPFVVAIFGILWLSGSLRTLVDKLPGAGTAEVKQLKREVESLKAEVQSLRSNNSTDVLELDGTLDALDRRIRRLEEAGVETVRQR